MSNEWKQSATIPLVWLSLTNEVKCLGTKRAIVSTKLKCRTNLIAECMTFIKKVCESPQIWAWIRKVQIYLAYKLSMSNLSLMIFTFRQEGKNLPFPNKRLKLVCHLFKRNIGMPAPWLPVHCLLSRKRITLLTGQECSTLARLVPTKIIKKQIFWAKNSNAYNSSLCKKTIAGK